MRMFKGLVFGVVIALSCIKLYTMTCDIVSGVQLWQSLSPQDKADILYIIKANNSIVPE